MSSLPWSEKYRPSTIDDILLPSETKKVFKEIVDNPESMQNMLFSGSCGIGKTTLAKILCKQVAGDYLFLNASKERGMDTIRGTIENFVSSQSLVSKLKICILDESDGLRTDAQDAYRGILESSSSTTRFIFTCNYPEKLTPAIKSRLKEVYFRPVSEKEILRLSLSILKKENIVIPEEQKKKLLELIKRYYPDIRKVLNHLEYFSKSGSLDIFEDTVADNEVINELLGYIYKKEFSNARKVLTSKKLSVDSLIISLYNDIIADKPKFFDNSKLNEGTRAAIILELASCYKDLNLVTVKEIPFSACIINLISILGGK